MADAADAVYADPEEVFAAIAFMRISDYPSLTRLESVPKPDVGSALASAPLITLANVVTELPAVLAREMTSSPTS